MAWFVRVHCGHIQCFFNLWNFSKFRLEIYNFNLYKGFFNGKNGPNPLDFNFKNSKLPKSYDNFQNVARNIERFLFFSYLFPNFWVLLASWALEVGSLLPDFYSFKFQGSLFHSSKLNVNMEFIDFES